MSVLAYFLVWWPFIDGQLLIKNVDIEELFETLPADRMMNVLDTLIVSDSISGSMLEGGIEPVRTKILSVYNGTQHGIDERPTDSEYSGGTPKPMHSYAEVNDDGSFDGLEAPLGLD